jgi:two-component system, sensor histidine kinase and response regulator
MTDHRSERARPAVGGDQNVLLTGASNSVDVQDPRWPVRMTRAAFVVSVVAHVFYITNNYVVFGWSLGGAMLPYGLLALCASLASAGVSFSPGYIRYWKYVTFSLCLCLMAAWTGADLRSGQQVEEAFGLAAMMVATCVLCPWEPQWQVMLAIGAVISFAINTAFIRPMSQHIGYLWTDLLAIIGLTLASSGLWTRWRTALADTCNWLLDSEAQVRKVLDANIDSVSLVRLSDGRYVYVNEAFLRRGYSREQVLGKSVEELAMADSEAVDGLVSKVVSQRAVQNQEVNVRMADGRIVPHLVSSVMLDVRGEQCVLSVARDVAELKKTQNELAAAQRRLEQSEAKLRKIFESCPETICVTSLHDGRYIDANPRFSTTGYTLEEVKAGPPDPARTWDDKRQFMEFVSRLLKDGLVENMEADFRLKDGSVLPSLISAAIIELDGEPCAVTFSSDISRLKCAEGDLIAAREAALAASRAKTEFLSSMSHEIRTPMNAILGMADLLAETNLTDEQRRFVETMINNGNALLNLINGILDLAKVESGRLNLEETDFDLADLVERIAETLAVRAHEKGIELLFRILPDVPTKLVGDPLRLRQILVNLLGNAIKFTEQGEVVLTVENDSGATGLVALRFSVRDTGIGISPDRIDSIFQTFTQVDSSTTRKFGGSGLGLAIARRLAELMNGRIWVESEPRKGSTFYFTACFGIGEHAISIAQPLDLNGVRVLIVDDNATNRLILREILSRRGAMLHEAIGGKEALTEIERARNRGEPYSLVLIDSKMPEMDGFEVAEHIKRDPRNSQPIMLMLTSVAMSPKLAGMRELAIDAYVVKPVKRSDLFGAIASAMSKAKTGESCGAATLTSASALPDGSRALKILLVEDSPDNRLLIEAYLKNFPYVLDVAENGAVAVEKFVHNRYDLVLMDVQMPVMDGLTATRRIRQWEQEHGRVLTPIVALTASALDEDVRQSMDAGCTAHLNKPVKKTLLVDVIHHLTDETVRDHSNGREAGGRPV